MQVALQRIRGVAGLLPLALLAEQLLLCPVPASTFSGAKCAQTLEVRADGGRQRSGVNGNDTATLLLSGQPRSGFACIEQDAVAQPNNRASGVLRAMPGGAVINWRGQFAIPELVSRGGGLAPCVRANVSATAGRKLALPGARSTEDVVRIDR